MLLDFIDAMHPVIFAILAVQKKSELRYIANTFKNYPFQKIIKG